MSAKVPFAPSEFLNIRVGMRCRNSSRLAIALRLRLSLVAAIIVVFVATPRLARAQQFTMLYQFQCAQDGCNPNGPLARDGAGNLYGAAGANYGEDKPGDIFEFSNRGVLSVLYDFTGAGGDGDAPTGVVLAGNALYGSTAFGGYTNYGTVFKLSKAGEKILYRFTGPPTDGEFAESSVILDKSRNIYGTTAVGGEGSCDGGVVSCGLVYMVAPNGKETVLHSFTGAPDGQEPMQPLTLDASGALYGTTYYGGQSACGSDPFGCGVVFKLTPAGDGTWNETVLHRFTGGTDGEFPSSALTIDAEGNVYGTTNAGGDLSRCADGGCGTIFKISKAGQFSVLYTFTGGADGAGPDGNLLLDAHGNFYGTASGGGNTTCPYGCGNIFKLTPSGHLVVLHTFNSTQGDTPAGGQISDGRGTLYGVTIYGGNGPCGGGCGTIYKFSLK